MEKYFLHRIQEEEGTFDKGIEVHDTLDSAVRSFWGRVKLAYNNPGKPNLTFLSCKITDGSGNVVAPFDITWMKTASDNKFFAHYIRKDGDTFSKGIDVCVDFDTARRNFAASMEYGYNNPQHPNVSFVSCEITDRSGIVLTPFSGTWNKPEEE